MSPDSCTANPDAICSDRRGLEKPPSREEESPPVDAGYLPGNNAGAMAVPICSDRLCLQLPPQAPPSVSEEAPEDNEPAAQLGPTTKGWAGQSGAWQISAGASSGTLCPQTIETAESLAARGAGHSSTTSDAEIRMQLALKEAMQFAVWDYDPGVLAATSSAVSIGCVISALMAVSGYDGHGGSDFLRYCHSLLLIAHSLFSAAAVMLLRTRGPHVRHVVINYQQLATSFMVMMFYIALATTAIRELRHPGSFGSIDTCIACGYTLVLSSVRLHWQWVFLAIGLDLAGAVLTGILVALPPDSMQRVFLALLLGGVSAMYLSYNRISHSSLQFQSLQRIRALATRNAEFLCTLIPSRVVERAQPVTNFKRTRSVAAAGSRVQGTSTSDDSRAGAGANTSEESADGNAEKMEHTANSAQEQHDTSSAAEENDTEVYTGLQLELQERLDDVLIMFCSLPPLDTLGSDRKAFRLLNEIFSAFDDEVRHFKMFKYHHVFNTYIVASPSAALRHSAYKQSVDEHAAMLALAVRLKAIAARHSAVNGSPLWLAIGMDIGNMVGKIVGAEKSFWCLFGSAINVAARLSHISARDLEYENSIAVTTKGVADKLSVVRSKIAQGSEGKSSGGRQGSAAENKDGGASDSGVEKEGIFPGFTISEMGLQSIKGQGEMLLFSVAETATVSGTPEGPSDMSSAEEGALDHYSGSYKQRARAGLMGLRGRGGRSQKNMLGVGDYAHNRTGGGQSSSWSSRGSRRKVKEAGFGGMEGVEEEEPGHSWKSGDAEVGSQGGSSESLTFKQIAEKWKAATAMLQPAANNSEGTPSESDDQQPQLVRHWSRASQFLYSDEDMLPSEEDGETARNMGKRNSELLADDAKFGRVVGRVALKCSPAAVENDSSQLDETPKPLASADAILLAPSSTTPNSFVQMPALGMWASQARSYSSKGEGRMQRAGGQTTSEEECGFASDEMIKRSSSAAAAINGPQRTAGHKFSDRSHVLLEHALQRSWNKNRSWKRFNARPGILGAAPHQVYAAGARSDSDSDPSFPISRRDRPFGYGTMRRLRAVAQAGSCGCITSEEESFGYSSEGEVRSQGQLERVALSPRSLLRREAERLQMEAVLRARMAFRKLGLRKISERSGDSIASSSSNPNSTTSSRQRTPSGSFKGSFKHSFRGSFRSTKSGKSTAESSSGADSRSVASSAESPEGTVGSFRSLLNDSFKQNLLYEDSFKLNELEKLLDEQFPVERKDRRERERLGSSSDEQADKTLSRRLSQFKNPRISWIQKIISSCSSINRTSRTLESTTNTRSSTSRLLAGEVEWFNDDSVYKLDHNPDGTEITIGGSFWRRRQDWHDNPLMRHTGGSQSLSGFGRVDSPTSLAPSLAASFSSSLSQLWQALGTTPQQTPAGTVTSSPHGTGTDSATSASASREGRRLRRNERMALALSRAAERSSSPPTGNDANTGNSSFSVGINSKSKAAYRTMRLVERTRSSPDRFSADDCGSENEPGRPSSRGQGGHKVGSGGQQSDPSQPSLSAGSGDDVPSMSRELSQASDASSLMPWSREISNTTSIFGFAGSGNSITKHINLAPKFDSYSHRKPVSQCKEDASTSRPTSIESEVRQGHAEAQASTSDMERQIHKARALTRAAKDRHNSSRNSRRKKRRKEESTFRIVLPNGSHLSGLSKETFGKSGRVRVGTDDYVLQEFQVDSVWLDFLDAKQNELFQKEHCSTSSFVRRILVGGFAVSILFVGINVHGLVSNRVSLLYRPHQASAQAAPAVHHPQALRHRWYVAKGMWTFVEGVARQLLPDEESMWGMYKLMIWSSMASLVSGLALSLFAQLRDRTSLKSKHGTSSHRTSARERARELEKIREQQEQAFAVSIKVICRVYRILQNALRFLYIAVSFLVWVATEEAAWTVDFCLSALALACMGNGMSTRENSLMLLASHALLLPCISAWSDQSKEVIQGAAGASVHVLLGLLAYYATRIETAGHLSTWIGLQLLASQRMRMGEILKNLLPEDMVEMVLSLHFKSGNEPLPITLCRERRAIVLHLDLKNYTGLTASLDPGELARHINEIFTRFDHLVYSNKSKAHGLFKIDTIGDAYEAAAWLSDLQEEESDVEGQEEEPSQRQRDAEVCACVVNVAWAMIDAVKSYAASRGARIECRIGISSGQVLAGMLGKLQPRFHLMGEAVWGAHKLEASAEVNSVRVGEDVQSLLADFLPTLIELERGGAGAGIPTKDSERSFLGLDTMARLPLVRERRPKSKAKKAKVRKELREGNGMGQAGDADDKAYARWQDH